MPNNRRTSQVGRFAWLGCPCPFREGAKLTAPRIRRSGHYDPFPRAIPEAPSIRPRLNRNRSAGHNRVPGADATSNADADSVPRRVSATSRPASRCETIDLPGTVGAAAVAKPIVETIRPALPEFDLLRYDAIAAPMRRGRKLFAFKTLGHPFENRPRDFSPGPNPPFPPRPHGGATAR